MKTAMLAAGLFLVPAFITFSCNAQGRDIESGNTDEKTLSPYFFVKSSNQDVDQMPLKETSAEVNIAGVIADVVVKQVYVNSGKKTLEAIYIFPGSTRAAVYAMRMRVGERILTAKIDEREKARKDYEAAKQQGKTASLLEQQRPNVFQMNVTNILPGDTITVELQYTELLIPESGIYEFVYPTVVGPRYSNQPVATASASEFWVENPYTHSGEKPSYKFDINTTINAGMAIKEITCASHDVKVDFTGKTGATVLLKDKEAYSGNRDYILKYRLAGSMIESGVLLHKGEKENFFLAMLQPPQRVLPEQIPGREYIFIVDVSGSMYGYPIEISKKLLKDLIGNLRPTDKFNVLLFAGGNSVMSEKSIPATKENINKAIHLIENQQGGGGTELLPALNRALSLPKDENFSRTVVIATDGYVTVEKEAFDLIRSNLGNSNFFTFGIGTSVNRYIIEGMARMGNGEPFVVTKESEAAAKADKFREYIQTPVLTNVKVDFGKFEVYDVEPLNIPDVLAERPVLVFGKWKGEPKGTLKFTGITGEKNYEACLEVNSGLASADNSALKYLWARQKIMLLDDYGKFGSDQDLINQVTQLGLEYNLLTAYTSFVAIDSVIRGDGKVIAVKQPLPLPEGVSDLAVGTPGGIAAYGGIRNYAPNMKLSYDMSILNIPGDNESVDALSEGEPVFVTVEQMPEFQTGQQSMMNFIQQNLQYPENAKAKKIEGTVYVSFIVDETGKITDVKVEKGVSKELDAEAVRVIKKMPSWKPGAQQGKPVKTRMMLPIKFSLS